MTNETPQLTFLLPNTFEECPVFIDLFGRNLMTEGYSITDVAVGLDSSGRYASMTIVGYRQFKKDDGTPGSVTFELLPIRRTEQMRLMDGEINILEALRVSDVDLIANRDELIKYRLKIVIEDDDILGFIPAAAVSEPALTETNFDPEF